MKLLRLKNMPIIDQLRIEEALLRANDESWCIMNEGAPPAIVMGISGKTEELDHQKIAAQNIPVIRRFSGGGTVVVDDQTLFVTFIGAPDLLDIPTYPEPLMCWSANFYKEALNLPNFALRENDYVIGDHKVGGNAQYIRKNRWLHHTTFLWDYQPHYMACLKLPARRPTYRDSRPHTSFLTKLKDHLPSPDHFFNAITTHLGATPAHLDDVLPYLQTDHRKATHQVNLEITT